MAQRKTKSQMFFSGWCYHFFKFLPIFGEDVHFDEHIFCFWHVAMDVSLLPTTCCGSRKRYLCASACWLFLVV